MRDVAATGFVPLLCCALMQCPCISGCCLTNRCRGPRRAAVLHSAVAPIWQQPTLLCHQWQPFTWPQHPAACRAAAAATAPIAPTTPAAAAVRAACPVGGNRAGWQPCAPRHLPPRAWQGGDWLWAQPHSLTGWQPWPTARQPCLHTCWSSRQSCCWSSCKLHGSHGSCRPQ